MSGTIREIVDDALNVLGEVAGAGVSQYSEDRMFHDTIRSFNLLFKKYYWPNYMEWFRVQLDGTFGVVPENTFDHVRDVEDFQAVYRDGEGNPLPVLPRVVNPYSLDSAGTQVRFWTYMPVTNPRYANRFLQFYPITSTEYVNVNARVYPKVNGTPWDWEDVMYMDKDMLVCGTAFLTLSSDDINPGAADAQRNMMEMRYKDILAAFSNQPVATRSRSSIPDRWQVAP